MSFHYDPTRLSEEPLFQVRFRLGDTVEDTAFFQDEEITFALSQTNQDVVKACIQCVEAILPRIVSSSKGFTVGPYTEKGVETASYQYWSRLLTDLKKDLSSGSAPVMMPAGPSIFHYDMLGHGDHYAEDPRRCL